MREATASLRSASGAPASMSPRSRAHPAPKTPPRPPSFIDLDFIDSPGAAVAGVEKMPEHIELFDLVLGRSTSLLRPRQALLARTASVVGTMITQYVHGPAEAAPEIRQPGLLRAAQGDRRRRIAGEDLIRSATGVDRRSQPARVSTAISSPPLPP